MLSNSKYKYSNWILYYLSLTTCHWDDILYNLKCKVFVRISRSGDEEKKYYLFSVKFYDFTAGIGMTQDQGRFWRYWFPKPGTSYHLQLKLLHRDTLTCSTELYKILYNAISMYIIDRFVSKIFHPVLAIFHLIMARWKTRKNKEK